MTTREEWVGRAIGLLRPVFRNVGAPVPEAVAVRVSDRLSGDAIGLCSKQGEAYEVAIHGTLIGKSVLPVLVHELLHAAVGVEEGHRGRFVQVGHKLGLWANRDQPKGQYGPVSWNLHQLLRQLEAVLGPYPSP